MLFGSFRRIHWPGESFLTPPQVGPQDECAGLLDDVMGVFIVVAGGVWRFENIWC